MKLAKIIVYLFSIVLISTLASCLASNINANYSTGKHDDGISLKLHKDKSFTYDRWSDCGLDRKGRGTYTIKSNILELNFEYDSIKVSINNIKRDNVLSLNISLDPKHEESYHCYKLIAADNQMDQNCQPIKSNQTITTNKNDSRILKIYLGLEQSRYDSLQFNIINSPRDSISKTILYSDPNYSIHTDSTWVWKINRRKIEMHNSIWEMRRVKNGL